MLKRDLKVPGAISETGSRYNPQTGGRGLQSFAHDTQLHGPEEP